MRKVASEVARKHRSFVQHMVHKQAPPVPEDEERCAACVRRFGKSKTQTEYC